MTSFFTSQKILFTTPSHLIPQKTLPIQSNLAVFIRGVMPDFKIYEEYLTMRSIHGSTKETDMFHEFHATLLETQLDPSKLFAVVTDRCPSTLGANQGLPELENKWCEENDLCSCDWHHCILHQKSLAAKSLDMSNVTRVVISTVNWIWANALNHCKFKKLLADVDFLTLFRQLKHLWKEKTSLSLAMKNGLLV